MAVSADLLWIGKSSAVFYSYYLSVLGCSVFIKACRLGDTMLSGKVRTHRQAQK